jgi:hypothetical protein
MKWREAAYVLIYRQDFNISPNVDLMIIKCLDFNNCLLLDHVRNQFSNKIILNQLTEAYRHSWKVFFTIVTLV